MVSRGRHDRGNDQASLVSSHSSCPPPRPYFWIGPSESIFVCAEPEAYMHVAQMSPFSKEACVCTDDRDPVLFHSRRAGILPVCPAPDYLRQEGGCHGTQI